MPQRTNDFQRLIAMVYTKITPKHGRVTESAMLYDKDADTLREVDILVEQRIAHHDIRVMIECRDRARKDSVIWIDELVGKAKSLMVDKVVAVSKHGFSEPALKKAMENGIVTLSVQDALETDWLAFPFKPAILLITDEVFVLQDVQYHNGAEFRSLAELGKHSKVIEVEKEIGSVEEIFVTFFHERLIHDLQARVNEERKTLFPTRADIEKTVLFESEYDLSYFWVRGSQGEQTSIEKIKFITTSTREVADVNAKHQKFNGVMISTAQHVDIGNSSVIRFNIVQDPETNMIHGSWQKVQQK